MFRSSTILRELVQSLAKVIFWLKHSLKLRSYIQCGDVAACLTGMLPHLHIVYNYVILMSGLTKI